MKLSILILTLKKRADYLTNLLAILKPQMVEGVEIIVEWDEGELSIGEKRNKALERAEGKYTCFIDDDDEVSSDYVKLILEAIETNPDCCSLNGEITINNGEPEQFEHSIKYDEYKTNSTGVPKYERYPNHLNVIRKSIAEKFSFVPINHGEDTQWATQINVSGELKTEVEIKDVIYFYNFIENK